MFKNNFPSAHYLPFLFSFLFQAIKNPLYWSPNQDDEKTRQLHQSRSSPISIDKKHQSRFGDPHKGFFCNIITLTLPCFFVIGMIQYP